MRGRSNSNSPDFNRRPRSGSRSPDGKRPRGGRDRSRSPRGLPPQEEEDVNPGNNLYVSGLSIKTQDGDLKDVFSKYGSISKCNIMYDPHTKESRGFGFVCFEKSEDANEALSAMNNSELHGKRISIEKARRGKARPSTPGTYYGPTKRREVMPWFMSDPRYGDRFDPRFDRFDMRPDLFRGPRDFRGPPMYPPPDRFYDRSYDRGGYDGRYERREDRDRDRERRRYDGPRESSSYRSRPY
ncbi:hypothetical protein HK096_009960 [Nowakowskiella sp. JEL0078]|nr:hypothetical protein HK096_009960 [Nowakowskiella sp. JEL0078]